MAATRAAATGLPRGPTGPATARRRAPTRSSRFRPLATAASRAAGPTTGRQAGRRTSTRGRASQSRAPTAGSPTGPRTVGRSTTTITTPTSRSGSARATGPTRRERAGARAPLSLNGGRGRAALRAATGPRRRTRNGRTPCSGPVPLRPAPGACAPQGGSAPRRLSWNRGSRRGNHWARADASPPKRQPTITIENCTPFLALLLAFCLRPYPLCSCARAHLLPFSSPRGVLPPYQPLPKGLPGACAHGGHADPGL
jgi:hypothetical protein